MSMRYFYKSHIFQGLFFVWIIMVGSILLTQWIGEEAIAWWVGDNAWSVPVFILLKAVSVVFAPLSGGALYVIAPSLWSWWLAILYVTIGNAIGISVAYWLGYRYADRAIGWFIGKKSLGQAHSIVDKVRGYWQFLSFRVLFFPLEDLINFVAGMARVPFWWFFLVSMIITTLVFGLFVGGFSWINSVL